MSTRISFRQFDLGLWVRGPRDTVPQAAMRRARGVHALKTGSARSRWGSVRLHNLDAHSLFRFDGVRFQAVGGIFYRNGVVIKSDLDGNRLAFVRMPPTAGIADYLFGAGGGDLFKVDSGGAVTVWGIVAPPDGFTQADNGAGNLTGIYKYKVTFRNSVSGHRSNANPTEVTTANLSSRQIRLSSLPVSADAQVNQREIWRTVGNGAVFFRAGTVDDNTTTTFDDNIADADLESTVLPTDNDPPDDDFDDVFGPADGRIFWTRDGRAGRRGRVYYSPVGRPEAQEGFIDPATDDDPIQKGVIWNGIPWVFSKAHVFQILGQGPFTWREISGAPGTTRPFTVKPTPFGIIYEAHDGARLMDGAASRLIGAESIGPLFRGESGGGISAFSGVVAEYARGEYLISDETATLALNLDDLLWRDVGIGAKAFHYEDDTNELIASFAGKVMRLEVEGVTDDDGAPISFDFETGSGITDIDIPGVMLYAFIEADTDGELLTPTLILDNAEITLPKFQTAQRETVEYGIGRSGRVVGMRLTGKLTKLIEIFSVEIEVYTPKRQEVVPGALQQLLQGQQ